MVREHGESRHPRPRIGPVVWLAILVVIGIVQVMRGQWVDAAVFGGLAVLLGVDALGLLPLFGRLRRPPSGVLLAGSVIAATALCLLPRHSAGMMAAVALTGAAALLSSAPSPHRADVHPWPAGLRRLAWAWAVIWVIGCLWELFDFLRENLSTRSAPGPSTLSELLDPLLDAPLGRVMFVICWAAIGLFLVTRGVRGTHRTQDPSGGRSAEGRRR